MNISKRFKIAFIPIIFIFIFMLSFSFHSCKGFGIPDWTLEIIFEEGVSGTPGPGVYSYEELTTVEYSYYPIDEQNTVEVLLNNVRWPAAGELIMYTNTKVLVRLFDIRGNWDFTLEDNDSDDEMEFSISFFGENVRSGGFNDSQGYSGTWNINGTSLTITYTDWFDYVLTGGISSMSGDWSGNGKTGTWSATRQQ
ncbi:MAG: hypothetical protein PVH61_23860 [Candidatus Aminicenantes bacterium]|jgi:hypothetical protein